MWNHHTNRNGLFVVGSSNVPQAQISSGATEVKTALKIFDQSMAADMWLPRATYVPYGIALVHNTSLAKDKKTLFHVTCNLPCGIVALYAGSCCRWMEGPEGVMVG